MKSLTARPSLTTADAHVPLVLLPGMNCTADLWADCGLDSPITPTLDAASIDSQVELLLDTLPLRFALAGLSLGGIIAMALVRKAPDRVTRLCLMSTNAKAPTDVQRQGWQVWRDRLAAGDTPRDLQNGILGSLLGNEATTRDQGLAKRVLRMGDDTGAERLDAQLRMQATRGDELSKLSELRMPVHVVSGDADAICPPPLLHGIAEAIPGALLRSVSAGHLLPMERPATVAGLLTSWLSVSSR